MEKTVLAGVGVGAAAFAISDVVNREMSPVGETISRFVNTGAGWRGGDGRSVSCWRRRPC